jgi:hypothetical protein
MKKTGNEAWFVRFYFSENFGSFQKMISTSFAFMNEQDENKKAPAGGSFL